MNEKARPNTAYNPTAIEHVANVITHGVSILYLSITFLENSCTALVFIKKINIDYVQRTISFWLFHYSIINIMIIIGIYIIKVNFWTILCKMFNMLVISILQTTSNNFEVKYLRCTSFKHSFIVLFSVLNKSEKKII